MDEQRKKKAWVKKGNPYLFIKAAEIMRLPLALETHLFPKRRAMARLGYPHPY